jgi:tetratricopeptide (TPR) repeat protein
LKISDVDIEKIIAGIDDLAAARNDDTLLLCMASIKERQPDQAILDRIIVDESNWKVMRFYFDMKGKLLDFLLGKFMFFEAAEILARFDGAAKAAELLEAHNLFKEAASYYESALEWQKAEALYLRSGDEKSIARLYEHKGDFTEAIERWKKLGYPKQAARLEKKAQKFTDRGQTPLFNF